MTNITADGLGADILNEQLISLSEASRKIPCEHPSGAVPIRTIRNWEKRGVRGIRLETIRIGGRCFTSIEAVKRFCKRLNGQVLD